MQPKDTILIPLVCLPLGVLRSHTSWVTKPWATASPVSSRWKKKKKATTMLPSLPGDRDSVSHHSLLKLTCQYYVCFPFPTTAPWELFCWGTSPAPCLSGALRARLNFHVFPARGCAFQTLSTRPNKRLIIGGDGKEERSPW